jgi:hypothetical protein
MKFKSIILAGALVLVAYSAVQAQAGTNDLSAELTNGASAYLESMGIAAGQDVDPAMVAINAAIDLTKSQAHAYNCSQPASVKPDTCSIHRTAAKATRANKLSTELTAGASKHLESMGIAPGYDAPKRYVDKGTWDVQGPVGGKFPLAGR